ncbi:MAG: 30S ribosomal protein S8 [Nitrospirae bacterium CG_4_9_14_3_um_filter_53_35]|nr:MAG: 30S ribosomal protein S8 [Nitrospirae bacterium CG2_30_53_67]PIS37639.1 MAG: 30S ribosomal protein S8 [Nitrospirae bacterium CG08_land_8_20_14_0_20_52_24]PIV82600.1 MAG: 30S ribosomal protein S8 [Nitrospirae bacterium CG17_big_fil_post_rev_8_21_14_2_50_50_9]PIW86015.1 MAG: 30S ribosomal protein S8 [Nitrospirae bacterium CG_4_8_14_3_um_filter_50_41]PIX86881.1 MAG: 30S ribosomal protein S8 [Nitrospirae bacterium CG_4_10_14_3_um_filter_53_41]PJA76368.1 MAG: 30S ribosomal protein S8 [Nitro
MSMTDPIADMLTRIRNAVKAQKQETDVPASEIKIALSKILKEEGFIKNFKVLKDSPQGTIRISLKKPEGKESVIHGIDRISKPGMRVYVKVDEIPNIRNGLGVAILSTPKGVITDRQCRKEHVGGEVLCAVW